MVVTAASAWSQVKVGETSMGLSGDAQAGYSTNWGDNQISSHSVDFGFNALLDGSYYSPKFLTFSVNPYLNQSRQNSNFNSIYGASGVIAGASLFSDTWHPINFNFSKDWNNEHQFNVPGSLTPYYANGSDQAFGVGGGLNLPNLPTFNANYAQGHSNFDVLGVSNPGFNQWHAFGFGSSYTLWGTGLGASYGNIHSLQDLGTINNDGSTQTDVTNSSLFTITANRHLWDSVQASGSYSHSNLDTDYSNLPSSGAFNTYSANISSRPLKAMALDGFVNYTDNLYNYLLQNFVPGSVSTDSNGNANSLTTGTSSGAGGQQQNPSPQVDYIPANTASNYLAYGARAFYQFSNSWNASGGVDHRVQNYVGVSSQSTDLWGGTSYSHPLAGGHYGVNGSVSTAFVEQGSPTLGFGLGGVYSHKVKAWDTSVGVQYSHSQATSILTYTSSGYGFNLSASRKLLAGWRFAANALVGKNHINGLSNSDTSIENFGATVSSNHLSFAGNYSQSSGNSLLTSNGLTPLPPDIPSLYSVLYSGNSYTFAVGYRPNWHWNITSSYAYAQYHTDNLTTLSDTKTSSFNSQAEYDFRQLRFITGYSRLSQGVGLTFNQPQTVNAFFVGISRHFDVF